VKDYGWFNNKVDTVLIVPNEIVLNENSDAMFREKNIENIETHIKALPTNFFKIRFFRENIGVSILKSYLSKFSYSSEIVYMDEYINTQPDIINKIISVNPTVIGISIMYNLHLLNAIQITIDLRRKGYTGHIVYGGPCATLLCAELLNNIPWLDSVALGEGEITLRLLVEYIKEKKPLSDIPGLAFRFNGVIKKSAPTIVENLDDLPFANRDYLELFKAKLGNMMTVCSIYTSRGCAGKCTFCSAPSLGEYSPTLWRCRSVNSLLNEMSLLVEQYGIKYFDIIDENFFGYGTDAYIRLENFANGIIEKKLKISFRGEIRADAKLNHDILIKLKNAGLTDILLGIESGSQSVLNRWQKGTKISMIKSVINLVQTMGFNFDPAFIMVDPITTVDEFLESIDFIIDTQIYKCEKPLYLFNEMIIFPGTKIHEQFLKDGVINEPEAIQVISLKSSQQDINAFCQKISFCDYTIKDKHVCLMWTALKGKVNYLTNFIEIRMPSILSELNKRFSDQDLLKKELIINKIRLYNKWLKGLSELTKELLLCAKGYLKDDIKEKQFESSLQECIDKFSNNALGEKIEGFITTCNSFLNSLN